MTRRGTQDGTRSAKRTIGDEKILARARPIIAKLRIAIAEAGDRAFESQTGSAASCSPWPPA